MRSPISIKTLKITEYNSCNDGTHESHEVDHPIPLTEEVSTLVLINYIAKYAVIYRTLKCAQRTLECDKYQYQYERQGRIIMYKYRYK